MKKFYSALVINSKLFPGIHQVLKPRFNKEYFKRLTVNIDLLEGHIEKRCKQTPDLLDKSSLIKLKQDVKKLVELKNRVDRIKDEDQLRSASAQLEAIEDRVLPAVISIPNRLSKTVPETDTILSQVKSDWPKEGVIKMLSHTKLSYINHCYSKSVVGPNSSYYFGIAAKLHYGIRDYFRQNLEKNAFIPLSGLCLTKSAIVEAVNSKDHKDYFTDPCRILSDDTRLTATHLVEASRESLVGFLTTLGHRSSNKPLRLLTCGSSYCIGSEWFDSDDKRASQFETIHTLVHMPSIEKYSMLEYETVRDIIWDLYSNLGLPVRLVHCCVSSMQSNEYDTHRIDVWLPSRSQWIETARISHYLDYITVRSGMKRGHMIDSMVYDSRALVAAIIENNQTSIGKFSIPTVIEEYMPHIGESERNSFLRAKTAIETVSPSDEAPPPMLNVFSNYQQRRYLVKKTYLFGHSKRYAKNNTHRTTRAKAIFITFVIMLCWIIDWESIWVDYLPYSWKRFLYEYFYRPARRIYWSTIYVNGAICPPDTPFDEMDKSHFDKDISQRRKESFEKHLPKGRFFPFKQKFTNDDQDEKVGDNNGNDRAADKVNE